MTGAILLAILPNFARSEIIQVDCLGGSTQAHVNLIQQVLETRDTVALLQMVASGTAERFNKGEVVTVTGHAGFLWYLVKVRKRGEVES
jgi:hypothetical protein